MARGRLARWAHRPLPPSLRTLIAVACSACGSRTGIEGYTTVIPPRADATAGGRDAAPHDASRDARDATQTVEASASHDAGFDGGCPAAVLAGSPLPMLGSCSTRDGRARVAGPLHPHITWTSPDPAAGLVLNQLSFVAADAKGGAYLAGNVLVGETTTQVFARVDGASGHVDWATTIPLLDIASFSPFLRKGGDLEDFAYGDAGSSIEAFDPGTGTLSATPLPPALSGAGIPAIGTDGSLYVPNVSAVVIEKEGVISRLLPDGTLAWTSENLAQYTASFGGFYTLALAPGDVSIVAENDTTGAASVIIALEPANGTILWKTSVSGQLAGGPAVAPDGSIAVITANEEQEFSLSILEQTGTLRSTHPVLGQTLQAIGLNGDVIISGSVIDGTGATTWGTDGGLLTTTLDANGTVFELSGGAVAGLDFKTGATLWSLSAPEATMQLFGPDGSPTRLDSGAPAFCNAGVQDAVLTSTGALIALTCSGALFGASD